MVADHLTPRAQPTGSSGPTLPQSSKLASLISTPIQVARPSAVVRFKRQRRLLSTDMRPDAKNYGDPVFVSNQAQTVYCQQTIDSKQRNFSLH